MATSLPLLLRPQVLPFHHALEAHLQEAVTGPISDAFVALNLPQVTAKASKTNGMVQVRVPLCV